MKKQSGEAWQIARSFLHLLSCAPGGRFFIILAQAGGALGIWRAKRACGSEDFTGDSEGQHCLGWGSSTKILCVPQLGACSMGEGKTPWNGHRVPGGSRGRGSCSIPWSQITRKILDSSCVRTKVWECTAAIIPVLQFFSDPFSIGKRFPKVCSKDCCASDWTPQLPPGSPIPCQSSALGTGCVP